MKKERDWSDPVSALVLNISAREFTQWLVEHHGLKSEHAGIVETNLHLQFKWHRLQGRLDRRAWLRDLARLWGLWRDPRGLSSAGEVQP